MKIIDKKYAVIYVLETLEDLENCPNRYVHKDLSINYYQTAGSIKWNYYEIIPKELLFQFFTKENFKEGEELQKTFEKEVEYIQTNTDYCRKYVMEQNLINSFIENQFPDLTDNLPTLEIVKGNNWKDVKNIVKEIIDGPDILKVGSFLRNVNDLEMLQEMDILRRKLILYPNLKVIFYSHIDDELFLAEKKFDLFIKNCPKPIDLPQK